MPHPLAGAVLTAILAGATSLIGAWVRGSRARYLRYWASARLAAARLTAFVVHAAIGLAAWKLATDFGWVPAHDPSLWPLDSLAYAGAAEAAFRAEWTGLWLESAEGAWSFVRQSDRLLGRAVGARARRAHERVVSQLGDRRLITEAALLLTKGYGDRPSDPIGVALWKNLAENTEAIDTLGPLGGQRTLAQEGQLTVARTAVAIVVLDRIEAQDDTLGFPDGRARDLEKQIPLTRPASLWAKVPILWP